jgi:hypothetical protein
MGLEEKHFTAPDPFPNYPTAAGKSLDMFVLFYQAVAIGKTDRVRNEDGPVIYFSKKTDISSPRSGSAEDGEGELILLQ